MFTTRSFLSLSFAVMLGFSTGCGSTTQNTLAGGALGAGVGAGTGAIVGAVISNGDIAASAALGGAVGLPAGMLVGYLYSQYDTETERNKRFDEYRSNQDVIEQQQKELDAMREEVYRDEPDPRKGMFPRKHLYHGATLGVPM